MGKQTQMAAVQTARIRQHMSCTSRMKGKGTSIHKWSYRESRLGRYCPGYKLHSHRIGVTRAMIGFEGTMEKSKVVKLWQGCDAVCFDVDSTVCTDEGIDELAAFMGKGEEVAEWTMKAMNGNVSFL